MGVSKVEYGGNTIVDLTGDTVNAGNLLMGATAHNAAGDIVEGTVTLHGKNLLHNADWAYSLVNQRKHSGAVQNAYCIDRWVGNGSVAPIAGKHIVLTAGTTMTQLMEIIPAAVMGKQCTFSVDNNGTVEEVPISFPSGTTDAAEVANLSFGTVSLDFAAGTYSLNGISSSYVPQIVISVNRAAYIRRVYLELGESSHMEQSPPENFENALSLCQRYYLPLSSVVRYPLTRVFSKEIDGMVPVPVTMRVTPTMIGTYKIMVGNTAMDSLPEYDDSMEITFSIASFGSNALPVRANTSIAHGKTLTDNMCLQVTEAALSADL